MTYDEENQWSEEDFDGSSPRHKLSDELGEDLSFGFSLEDEGVPVVEDDDLLPLEDEEEIAPLFEAKILEEEE